MALWQLLQGFFVAKKIVKSETIPNPVFNIESTRLETNYNKAIIAVGKFTKQKNYPLLLKSFSILSKKYPDYSLIIYGWGRETR